MTPETIGDAVFEIQYGVMDANGDVLEVSGYAARWDAEAAMEKGDVLISRVITAWQPVNKLDLRDDDGPERGSSSND